MRDDFSTETDATVMLAHGGGGQLTDQLLHQLVLPRLGNPLLSDLLDSADLGRIDAGRLAMTIDAHVVKPWRFPGGDIGRLAVAGTVNDLAVCGATPLGLALSVIVSEGFAEADLAAVLDAIASTAREAEVRVVTGDTKVIGRTDEPEIYLTTAAVGVTPEQRRLHPDRVRPTDAIVINGSIGEHGLAVMLAREMPEAVGSLRSDVAPLNGLIDLMLDAVGDDLVFMRDATRGGLAGVAADLAQSTRLHVTLDEESIPTQSQTHHAAELLGLDLLDVANEGKVVAVVRSGAATRLIDAMHEHPLGQTAAIIGHVDEPRDGLCDLLTGIGGRRIIQKPYGEQLPRIC